MLCVQVTPPPSGLAGLLSDLFVEQENARYQLRMQHIKERVCIVLLNLTCVKCTVMILLCKAVVLCL